jgi:DNA-binding XRE family transcriptional regulator
MNLAEFRVRHGLNQSDVAAVMGKRRATYSNIETGKQDPKPKTRKALAAALSGLTGKRITVEDVDDLLRGEYVAER